MNNITGGELEFSNTPYIKHRAQNFEREEYDYRSSGRRQNSRTAIVADAAKVAGTAVIPKTTAAGKTGWQQ